MPSQNRNIIIVLVVLGVLTACPFGAVADETPVDAPNKPAEESRLSTAAFRAGLKKRGLIGLLELHVSDFPSANPTDAKLMMRDVKLAEFADPAYPLVDRQAAVDQANRILEGVLAENEQDLRRFEWRFALAHSLIYDQAEPCFTSILYRGGSAADRTCVLSFSSRAVVSLRILLSELAAEYRRIDSLSIRAFDKLEARGYVAQLDQLAPRAEYLLLWTLFYDALPRRDDDPVKVSSLHEIVEWIEANPTILKTPHDTSHVQIQALLLTGMSHHLLSNHQAAREHLERALAVGRRLGDPAERERVQWGITLAWLERIRNAGDAGRFEVALDLLGQFRERISNSSGDNFGLRLVAALLERSILRLHAATTDRPGIDTQGPRYHGPPWQPLIRLARAAPAHRDEIYAVLYGMIGRGADPKLLDPFEQCALIAGLLFDANQAPDDADILFDRAIGVGELFLDDPSFRSAGLVAEVLYNVAVASYSRGRLGAAAQYFLEIAREHPTFANAPQAAALAAQLGAELYADPSLRSHPQVQQRYLEALEVLVNRYPQTEAAHYWRFFYAQLLDEIGRYDQAAVEYASVDPTHEHHVESVFFRVRCLAIALTEMANDASADPLELQRRTHEFFTAERGFVTLLFGELSREQDQVRLVALRALSAQLRVITAEVQILPHSDRPSQALETLAGFETEHPNEKRYAARIWRVRLMAYEKLGQLDEASRTIPKYMAADPVGAGPTLQSLYLALSAEVERLQPAGDAQPMQRKAELALLLAKQIDDWASKSDNDSAFADRDALTLQLGEANLRAKKFARARVLFESLYNVEQTGATESASTNATQPRSGDLRIILGHAESLFQLGEFAEALVEFNRLATGLPPSNPTHWRSLLRDLQCRTELHHPPGGIIKVILQQKHLYPELGGPAHAPAFEKLLRENERRLDQKP